MELVKSDDALQLMRTYVAMGQDIERMLEERMRQQTEGT